MKVSSTYIAARRVRERLPNGEPRCDLCRDNPGHQVHHLINKFQTMHSEQARTFSDQPELVALLCQSCHDSAPRKEIERQLWRFLDDLWGRERVDQAIAKVKEFAPNILMERDGD